MILLPLSAIPNQGFSTKLNGQSCQIALRQNGAFIYFSLTADGNDIVTYRACMNRQRLLIDARYRGFIGDFMFVDQTTADEPPVYTGLNSRWLLYYLNADE